MALEETPQTLLLLGPNICFLKSLVAIMKMPEKEHEKNLILVKTSYTKCDILHFV